MGLLAYQGNQLFLLPPSVADWVAEDSLARFVSDVVERGRENWWKYGVKWTRSARERKRSPLAFLGGSKKGAPAQRERGREPWYDRKCLSGSLCSSSTASTSTWPRPPEVGSALLRGAAGS